MTVIQYRDFKRARVYVYDDGLGWVLLFSSLAVLNSRVGPHYGRTWIGLGFVNVRVCCND